MSTNSSPDENEYSHRQGSISSLPEEDEQRTIISDSPTKQQRLEFFFQQRLSSPLSNEYSKVSNLDDTQSFNVEKEHQIASIDLQTVPDISNEDNTIQSGKDLTEELSSDDQYYQNRSESDSADDITLSYGLQYQEQKESYDKFKQNSCEEINSTIDYETLVRSKQLYIDPNPELIRETQMSSPLKYTQNITIKFLKPPPVPQGPLIIREVRPPQPPPPPPLIIRQRPPTPLPPPPIILREKPPRVPEIFKTQTVTKNLPPIPSPPRSVIIEKLPPLPPKPRDIIIERWLPYEFTTDKRKVLLQRSEESKQYPPPKNVIITYDQVQVQVVRQFQRLDVTVENPQTYMKRYGNSVLDTNELLAQARQLGITENISPPILINRESEEKLMTNSSTLIKFEKKSPNSSFSSSQSLDKAILKDIDKYCYAPTYKNFIDESLSLMNNKELNESSIDQENNIENLYAQLAQYGLTTESIPY